MTPEAAHTAHESRLVWERGRVAALVRGEVDGELLSAMLGVPPPPRCHVHPVGGIGVVAHVPESVRCGGLRGLFAAVQVFVTRAATRGRGVT